MSETAVNTMVALINETYGNLSSLYAFGQKAKDVMEKARADTTLGNVREFFEKDTCPNEVCYKCANIGNCKQTHEKKCF